MGKPSSNTPKSGNNHRFFRRRYKSGDRVHLQKIYDQCFDKDDSEYWSPAQLTEFIDTENAHAFILEEIENGAIAGFIYARTIVDEAELLIIGLGISYQGQRLSGPLLDFMIEALTSQKVTKIFLEVKENNRSAINLYKSRGFNQVGERPDYYKNRSESHVKALVLSLKTLFP